VQIRLFIVLDVFCSLESTAASTSRNAFSGSDSTAIYHIATIGLMVVILIVLLAGIMLLARRNPDKDKL
jgi:hypothetical protein